MGKIDEIVAAALRIKCDGNERSLEEGLQGA